MKLNIKSKFFGSILSDGSFKFLSLPSSNLPQCLNIKNVDILNHPVWTGQRLKEQTEISAFISRFHKIKKI